MTRFVYFCDGAMSRPLPSPDLGPGLPLNLVRGSKEQALLGPSVRGAAARAPPTRMPGKPPRHWAGTAGKRPQALGKHSVNSPRGYHS